MKKNLLLNFDITMFTNVRSYLELLGKDKLSQQQYLFLYILYKKDPSLITLYKSVFPNDENSFLGEYGKRYLVDNGWLILEGEGKRMSECVLTRKALDLFVDPLTAIQELIATYPATRISDGVTYPMANIKIPLSTFGRMYMQAIGDDGETHRKIIEALIIGQQNNYPFSKLESFVNSLGWVALFKFNAEGGGKESISQINHLDREM